jgi:methylenetetrahydrofolate reductase (NADPH)
MNTPVPPKESQLARRLSKGEFAITAEITPPVSGSAQTLLDKAMPLKGVVDAVNVTDGASARVHMSSVASAAILAANGIEPVVQFTCRDRNRIALMSDLLGAAALGIHNLLMLTGDDPTLGDQPEAKPVFDLASAALIELAATMSSEGVLPSSKKAANGDIEPGTRAIDTPPRFFVGAADTPTTEATNQWRGALRAKSDAGARFVQTQVCYDLDVIRQYAAILDAEGFTEQLSVLVSNGPLASARSAIWMRENLWGVIIPDAVVERLSQADDETAEGVQICAEQIQAMSEISGIAGVHMIAPTNTSNIPEAVGAATFGNRRT